MDVKLANEPVLHWICFFLHRQLPTVAPSPSGWFMCTKRLPHWGEMFLHSLWIFDFSLLCLNSNPRFEEKKFLPSTLNDVILSLPNTVADCPSTKHSWYKNLVEWVGSDDIGCESVGIFQWCCDSWKLSFSLRVVGGFETLTAMENVESDPKTDRPKVGGKWRELCGDSEHLWPCTAWSPCCCFPEAEPGADIAIQPESQRSPLLLTGRNTNPGNNRFCRPVWGGRCTGEYGFLSSDRLENFEAQWLQFLPQLIPCGDHILLPCLFSPPPACGSPWPTQAQGEVAQLLLTLHCAQGAQLLFQLRGLWSSVWHGSPPHP